MLPDILGLRKSKEALEEVEKKIEKLKGNFNSFYDEFHKHLDKCEQCEKNPWNLCSVGHELCGQALSTGFLFFEKVIKENQECSHDWPNAINGRCPWCRERKDRH